MLDALKTAVDKLSRDAGLPLRVRLTKAARYASGLAMARWYLRDVTERGPGVRVEGAPSIDNLGTLCVGAGSLLRSVNVPVTLVCGAGAVLEVGQEVRLNYGVALSAARRVVVGDRCRLGPYVTVSDHELDLGPGAADSPPRPVIIEPDVWLGAKASVLPGVTIGTGSVVTVGSVVAGDVAPYSVVAGNPARLVRKLDPTRFARAATG